MDSSNKNVAEEPLLFSHSIATPSNQHESDGELERILEPLLFSHSIATPSNQHESDGKLERILSDTTVPYFNRVGSASLIELKLLFIIAAPAVFVYLINYVMSMSTQILSGHLGTLELAAASLGNTGIQIFAYGLMSEKCKRTWNGFTLEAFSGLPQFFKLSAASAVMLCLETWYLQILVLLAGLLPNPEIALDSLSICTTISGWVFMISVGFNAAARLIKF
ncbi:protein TRANPARENT TESTA 12-like [Trifolium pratense]|uniref:Protein TRANPARENT TESTA 12-like n=1 Tax=Trifolium pratense TaxID=57577 RepID=A0A2K3LD13_TRIPR|nr:protein TRANPARENT TESTA 12-like [Trifolium pratense]